MSTPRTTTYWRPMRLAALFSLFSIIAITTGNLVNLGFLFFLVFLIPVSAKPRTSHDFHCRLVRTDGDRRDVYAARFPETLRLVQGCRGWCGQAVRHQTLRHVTDVGEPQFAVGFSFTVLGDRVGELGLAPLGSVVRRAMTLRDDLKAFECGGGQSNAPVEKINVRTLAGRYGALVIMILMASSGFVANEAKAQNSVSCPGTKSFEQEP